MHSATALPGLILEKNYPSTLKNLFIQLNKVVVITGTNGKTTTSRMLCHLLKKNHISYISNSSGSNLIRGIASTLIEAANWQGEIKTKLAILEVEEGSLPKLIKLVKPQIIIVTNIFRDQLDAYGEIDKTFSYLREGIEEAENPKLILNADDERVRKLKDFTQSEVDLISFGDEYLKHIKLENRNIVGERNDILKKYIIEHVVIDENLYSKFDIYQDKEKIKEVKIKVPGLHNTFNAALALIGFSQICGMGSFINDDTKNTSLEDFEPAFGRGEIIKVRDTNFQILLVKNPAGMDLNFHLLEQSKNREAILFLLNDNTADGKDISWIWDCDFELLKNLDFKNVFAGGSRVYDIALRLKYEGIEVNQTFEKIDEAIENILTKGFDKIYILPTYTAMLEFRKELAKSVKVKEIWK